MQWAIGRVSVSPEEAGLCGCWQFVVVRRRRQAVKHGLGDGKESCELGYYATSLDYYQCSAEQLLEKIRGHWSAIENGSHYRRDVSSGEDKCRVSKRTGAWAMAVLRNITNGLFEICRARGLTEAQSLPSWRRTTSVDQMIRLVTRPLKEIG